MSRFHISQDETERFQLTYEDDAGQLTLLSYDFDDPDQLVDDAMKLAKSGKYGDAVVVVDPSRRASLRAGAARAAARPISHRPAPRKAGA
jgi:hypothetical protein